LEQQAATRSEYVVLARRYRPTRFEEVIGQQHVTRTLQNAIRAGRVHHAYLFTGSRGVGKTTVARILARALNHEGGPTAEPPPLKDPHDDPGSADVIEIDGASHTGVDNVRELRESVRYLPSRSRHKIYIIDEVHMLSTGAFNALLKTLEEPPPHVVFVFATTEPHKIPATILSRCQRFDFKRVPTGILVEHMQGLLGQEGVQVEGPGLSLIARAAEGGVRDSLSLLDQVIAYARQRERGRRSARRRSPRCSASPIDACSLQLSEADPRRDKAKRLPWACVARALSRAATTSPRSPRCLHGAPPRPHRGTLPATIRRRSLDATDAELDRAPAPGKRGRLTQAC
jgi:DNA polymerase III delta prime subunit